MPGLIWLSLHPPRADLFPWWAGYLLDGMLAAALMMLVCITFCVGRDIIREWMGRP